MIRIAEEKDAEDVRRLIGLLEDCTFEPEAFAEIVRAYLREL